MDFQSFYLKSIQCGNEKLDMELVKQMAVLLESREKFPVSIEKLTELKVDSKKDHTIARLDKCAFKEGKDFCKALDNGKSMRVMLSLKCFEILCIEAQNEQGKTTLKYFWIIKELWNEYMRIKFEELQTEMKAKEKELTAVTTQLKHLDSLHQQALFRRKRHEYKTGSCLYFAPINDTDIKIGKSGNLTQRALYYKTTLGNDPIKFAFYTVHYDLLEQCMLTRFIKQRELNTEIIRNTSLLELTNAAREILHSLRIEYEEDDNMDEKYGHLMGNTVPPDISQTTAKFIENVSSKTKTCSRCGETKNRSKFGSDVRRPDGLSCYCKPCKRRKASEYSDKGKMILNYKIYKKCGEKLPIDMFHGKADTADGKQVYCVDCVNSAKIDSRAKYHGHKFKCPACDKIFELKDSIKRHWNFCHSEMEYDREKVVEISIPASDDDK